MAFGVGLYHNIEFLIRDDNNKITREERKEYYGNCKKRVRAINKRTC